jgi:exosortase A-associated hydrolase 2
VVPFFRETRLGYRFYLHHPPRHGRKTRGGILYLHPLAEEMNKARHVSARMARALAAEGWHVLQPDLLGCGDSSGDFGDATWEHWLADVDDAMTWLRTRTEGAVWIWGLRAGCILAADWLRSRGESLPLLLCHPVLSGSQHLRNFLRIRVMGAQLGGEQQGGTVAKLRTQLSHAGSLEVAGYAVSIALASGLERCELTPLPEGSRAVWLEVSGRPEPALSLASEQCIAGLRERGCTIDARVVAGPPFWQTVELTDCPALIEASLAALAERRA